MSATTDALSGNAGQGQTETYLNATSGIGSWLITIDHKRIGVMYLGTILFFFLIGGLAALGVRFELFTPEPTMSADAYNKMFTLESSAFGKALLRHIPSAECGSDS